MSMVNYKAIAEQELKRAAGYIRVSTLDQVDGVSLEHQQNEIQKWAVYKGYDIVDIYSDKGESGAKEDRAELNRLLRDAERGKFDMVVVFAPDRFSRRVRIATEVMYKLEDMGVGIKFINPDFDTTTPVGKMLFSMMAHFAEMDRESIKDKLLIGKKNKVKQGNYVSKRPYGYNVIEGKLVPNKKEAEVVREIFSLRAFQRLSLRKVADHLNGKGVPSPSGRRWGPSTINSIIKNEVYIGNPTQRVGEEVIKINMDYEAIISKRTFTIANQQRKEK